MVDNELENISDIYFDIFLKIKQSFVPTCLKFANKWLIDIDLEDGIGRSCREAEEEIKQIRARINRRTKTCIFFGDTSCGKSSLINAILECELLPSSFGSTSTCVVEVKSSPDNRSFLVVDGKEKEISLLKRLNNFYKEDHLPYGSHIDLFHDSVNCAMLRNDAALIDTPGIDEDIQTDEIVERYCNGADLIIMMVNSTSRLNNTIKAFVIRFQRYFKKLNLAIVYNFWDLPDKNIDREEVKSQFTEAAKEVLCGQLGYSDEEANERIHFLSAYERILVNRNDEELQWIPRWQSRNEAFLRFNAFLQREMEESAFERRYNYLLHLQSRLIPILHQCHSVVTEMSNKMSEQFEEIKGQLDSRSDLKKEVKESTISTCSQACDIFIEESLAIVKKDIPIENEVLKKERLNNKINELLHEILKKSVDDLVIKIKGYLMSDKM